MNTRHACLTKGNTQQFMRLTISIIEDGRPRLQNVECKVANIAQVHDLAVKHGVTHVWIMPGIELEPAPQNAPISWRVFGKPGKFLRINEVHIGYPAAGRWAWDCSDPVAILAGIYYLEVTLGIPVQWSPGHMGKELIKELNNTPARQGWTRESSVNLNELPFRKAASEIIWKQESFPDVPPDVPLYLHEYDKNSDYLSTMPGLHLGVGDPVHVEESQGWINTNLAGIYRVNLDDFRPSSEDLLPPLFTTEWITSDVLRQAVEHGYPVHVYEAWQFMDSHRVLNTFAERLWKGRQATKPTLTRFPHKKGSDNAYNTIKEIALMSTGKLAYKDSTSLARPDWFAGILGKSRVNKFRVLFALWRYHGIAPIMVYADGFYILSRDPNPRTAVPGFLDRENELGGFKHDGTWRVTPELKEAFNKLSAGQLVTWLNSKREAVA